MGPHQPHCSRELSPRAPAASGGACHLAL
jgi:hypothetical protein